MPSVAAEGFNWIVRKCIFGALLRGLQNLGASFIKGFNCCGAKLWLQCAASRFAKPRNSLQRRTDCHFLHRAKSNQKARGTPSCDLDSNRRSIHDCS